MFNKIAPFFLLISIFVANSFVSYSLYSHIAFEVTEKSIGLNDFQVKLINISSLLQSVSILSVWIIYSLIFHIISNLLGKTGKLSSFITDWGFFFILVLLANTITFFIIYDNSALFHTDITSVEGIYSDLSKKNTFKNIQLLNSVTQNLVLFLAVFPLKKTYGMKYSYSFIVTSLVIIISLLISYLSV